jgi:dolichyl-phosphooligosaccharide-protein glycotransferase
MRKNLAAIFLLSAVLIINLYFRLFPAYFPQLKQKAHDIVHSEIQKKVKKQINIISPDFSRLAKKQWLKRSVLEYERNNWPKIKNDIHQKYLELTSKYQDQNRLTYFMEADGWRWLRYTENVYRFGHPGDTVVNGKQIDSLMLVPKGDEVVSYRFLFYLSAWLYKACSYVNNFLPIRIFLFYLPLFFVAVFLLALYLFCRSRIGNLAAFTSCLFVGLAPIFLMRSCAGWFDTDVLNLFFPLLVTWFYLNALTAKKPKLRLGWLLLSSMFLGLFSFSWGYWWFILFIIIIFEIYSLAKIILLPARYEGSRPGLLKQRLFLVSAFVILTAQFVFFFSGVAPFRALFLQIKDVLSLNSTLVVSVWPNVLATVGELRKTNLNDIPSLMGSLPLIAAALSSMLLLFLRTLRSKKYLGSEEETIGLLFIWSVCMLYACSKGVRFTVFLLMPLGISLGWFLTEALRFYKKNFLVTQAIRLLLIAFVLSSAYQAGQTAKGIFPDMNNTWNNALIKIKNNTPKNAILNTWWDYGDWIKTVAERKVIFDGQTQNIPQAYWMANVLITESEKEAIAILRMLNNGGNNAFEIIDRNLHNPLASLILLKKALLMDKEKARNVLSGCLSQADQEAVLGLIFGKPPSKAYFLVDYSMPKIMPSISFVGNWDFIKVYLASALDKKGNGRSIDYIEKSGVNKEQIKKLSQEFNLMQGEDLSDWFFKKLSFRSRLLKSQEKDGIVLFNNGLVYLPKKKSAYFYIHNSYQRPKSLFIFNQGIIEKTVYPDSILDNSALIFKIKQDYYVLMLDEELARSIFVRLYFLNGAGLKYFKPFIQEEAGSKYIRVFEIDWK